MAPTQMHRIAAHRSSNDLDSPRTTPLAAVTILLADPDWTELRARLDVSTETDAITEILRHQTEALRYSGDLDSYLMRLASVLEEYHYGQHASHVGETECVSFWRRVLTAQLAMRRKAKSVTRLESAWPGKVLDYYGFGDLGTSAVDFAVRMAAWHNHPNSERATPREKELAWTFAAVELSRAMLHRDADWRDKQRRSPNVGQLIGQHNSRSTIQDPWRPLETQDFRRAAQSVDFSLLLAMQHNSWNWDRGRTWRYLKLHGLGFDQHGILVRATGRLDGDLLECLLHPKLPSTTVEQEIVLRSPNVTTSSAVNSLSVAAYNDPASQNRTTDHDYIRSHNLPRRGSSELGTAVVREDVPQSQNDTQSTVENT